jgi:hypothetical protein
MIIENISKTMLVNGNKYTYNYRLIKEKTLLSMEDLESNRPMDLYGIYVELEINSDGKTEVLKNYVKDISSKECKVHNLLNCLYEHTVSPIHLFDVVEDFLDKYILDEYEEVYNVAVN